MSEDRLKERRVDNVVSETIVLIDKLHDNVHELSELLKRYNIDVTEEDEDAD